jgi:hypothetical protein
MKTIKQVLAIGVAVMIITVVLTLVFSSTTPGISASLSAFFAQAAAPTPPPGEVIPLKSIDGLTSLNATVQLNVNGMINGQLAQGNLTGLLTTNNQGKSQISVTGSLLGEIAAQVGGSLMGMFTPSSVDIYKVPTGSYIVVNGIFPVCVKQSDPTATEALDQMSPQNLLGMLTNSDVARGKLVGTETLNGAAVKHYVINGDAFLAAAKKSSDPKLKAFAQSLWSAGDADLYVDAKGGYPVAFTGSYSGAYDPLKFEGDFDVQIELTGVNTNTPVNLPSSCNNPISR